MATVTSTELAVVEQANHEIALTPQQAMATKEIEGALILARRFPRNEDDIRAKALESCKRPRFAAIVRYSYPRGGSQVEGPSVYLARELARQWGNIRYGVDVVHDDDDTRTVRAWAWDLETNTRRQQDATFKKLVYRKKGGWVAPDERDLRELTNKHGETTVRNCLLHMLPPDLIDECMEASLNTLRNDAAKDPAEARKKLVLAFRGIGVTAEQIETYLGHKLAVVTPEEIANLRAIWKSITDGNSRWSEYVDLTPKEQSVSMDDLTAKQPAKQPDINQDPGGDAFELQDGGAETEEEARIVMGYLDEIDLLENENQVKTMRARVDADRTLTPDGRVEVGRRLNERAATLHGKAKK